MKFRKIFFILFGFIAPLFASAHIGYVLPSQVMEENRGVDWGFLLSVFTNSKNLVIMIAGLLILVLLFIFWNKIKILKTEVETINKNLDSYMEFVPWILRLSIGIALIGAGTAGVLISPIMSSMGAFSFVQILLGFFILLGFATSFSVLVALGLGVYAVYMNQYLLGSLDFLMGALAILLLGSARPGFDDIVGLPFVINLKKFKDFVPFILRIGIGGAMAYLAVFEKILNPHWSRIVVEEFHLTNVIPVGEAMWVLSAGAVELIVGFCLLIGLRTRLVSAIAFFVLSLSFFYFGEDVYSHITLFGVLSALFVTGGGKWSLDRVISK